MRAKLGDFSLSIRCEHHETFQGLTGSPTYVSPEQLKNERWDSRVDLFIVGIIFYEMVVGVHPFRKGTSNFDEANAKIVTLQFDIEQSNE